ncbi:hypothetical protein [Ornithinibacillus halophilus]|uniref:Uncharacterized protein n=1 Tax=Ornithinibacillus halophilus TaxID=930117 RepID=A0A1M5MYX7_9BACI|nr:hypothetical protein [Ornithinibacillus halophilus]SHG82427.1 hypothetical protein SAMN05216225_10683 [Ornithinibacillus halophilus]
MIILRSGVTGFQPAPNEDEKKFKQVCYALPDAKILEFIEEPPTKNYYECQMIVAEKMIYILLNKHYPFMASVTHTNEMTFIHNRELMSFFGDYYNVLSPEQLREPIRYSQNKNIVIHNENTLHQAELKQLVYWKPRSVGEVVFNTWD